jgi:hypothetical protein
MPELDLSKEGIFIGKNQKEEIWIVSKEALINY